MEVSNKSEANSCWANQEIPRILRNQSVHYCAHKRPPLVPVLSQMTLVHALSSYYVKIHFNVIFVSMSRSS
jgi:hypothetical protein